MSFSFGVYKKKRRQRVISVSKKIDIGCVREGKRGWTQESSSSLQRVKYETSGSLSGLCKLSVVSVAMPVNLDCDMFICSSLDFLPFLGCLALVFMRWTVTL